MSEIQKLEMNGARSGILVNRRCEPIRQLIHAFFEKAEIYMSDVGTNARRIHACLARVKG